ncbi:hypothetical protein [Phenylobacterium sp.]|uniref:hypothetical protein n=1 Tax=Phenylobacterium sp. TaxID=1871053 RepID=UPI0025DA7DF1|nr:hypothetical protein [Phenylobacterium sp.]MBX3484447.1 hypothetical protein [Phenylobacterium sp.]
MTTTPARRKLALDELKAALQARSHASVVHYACEGFDRPDGRIAAIAVRNLGNGASTLFDVTSRLPSGMTPKSAPPAVLDRAELAMLEAFDLFLQGHPHHHWLHWNMRDATFGFDALHRRQRALGGTPGPLPPPSFRIDLASRMFDLYGDRYAAPPSRLETLAARNGLSMANLIKGAEQGERVTRGDYRPVERSLLNRVDLLYSIAIKATEGTLKTDARWYDGIGGLGQLMHWLKEHPVYLAVTIGGGVLAVVATLLKIWDLWPW